MLTLPKNKIAIAPLFDPEKIGSIYVPDKAKERCDQGVVKYAGPDCKYLKVGDHILFGGYNGTTVQLEGEGVLIVMHEDFVVCQIESENTYVPGLYWRDVDGQYERATMEQSIFLITKMLEDMGYNQAVRSKEKFETARRENVYDARSR
jgi:co-chaperonin GroES (HSP10)